MVSAEKCKCLYKASAKAGWWLPNSSGSCQYREQAASGHILYHPSALPAGSRALSTCLFPQMRENWKGKVCGQFKSHPRASHKPLQQWPVIPLTIGKLNYRSTHPEPQILHCCGTTGVWPGCDAGEGLMGASGNGWELNMSFQFAFQLFSPWKPTILHSQVLQLRIWPLACGIGQFPLLTIVPKYLEPVSFITSLLEWFKH